MASELANLVQLYIEGCENCCSVSIIDLERMRRGIEALETALADEKAGRKLHADATDKLRETELALADANKRAEKAVRELQDYITACGYDGAMPLGVVKRCLSILQPAKEGHDG